MDINFTETLKYKDCLDKYVEIQTVDRHRHEGWMKSLDPLSGNIILVTLSNDKTRFTKTTLVIGDACLSVKVMDSVSGTLPDFHVGSNVPLQPEDLSKLKERLIAWIKQHRLPVKENENGSLIVCDSVTISAPYRPEDCISKNARILQKALEIIESLPSESETVESQLRNAAEEIVIE